LKRSGPHNRFELESLEPRILLSADAALASPCDLPDECESDFGIDLLPQIDEVAIGDEDRLEENSYQNQTTYDPSQSIDDIFAGLTEQNLIEGDDDSGDAIAFEEEDDHASEFEDEDKFEDDYDPANESENDDEHEDLAASEFDGASYENSVITSHQQDQIILGLNALSRLGGVLEKFDAFAAMLTQTIDRSVGEFLGFVEILDTRLAKPVYDYFNDATDPPDTQGVLQTKQISGKYGDLEIAVDSLDGGMAPSENELQFDLKINATRTGEVCAENSAEDVSDNSEVKQSVAAVISTLELDYSFGVDLENSDEFFVVVRQFDAALTIESHGSDADTAQELVQAPPEDEIETTEPAALIRVNFADTITADGRITL